MPDFEGKITSSRLSDNLLGVGTANSPEAEAACRSSWLMKQLSREENEDK